MSSSWIHYVRVYLYKQHTIEPDRLRDLVALAYATARDQHLSPTAILIRADLHDRTTVNGKYQKDPKGFHGTFSYKYVGQANNDHHVTTHGYTTGRDDFNLREAKPAGEKPDSTIKGRSSDSPKVVWPKSDELDEYKDSPIGYSHLSK